jgi:hypothetical protein
MHNWSRATYSTLGIKAEPRVWLLLWPAEGLQRFFA